jgi:hypothetical protein
MGHHVNHKKSKPQVAHKRTVAARPKVKRDVSCQPSGSVMTPREPLAGLSLTDAEWDSLFCMAVRHHFESEQVWVPSVLRTMALLEGINDKTGRPCRIYVRPGKRVLIVETLS